jgi:antitoxin ParD1/3/4
MSLTPELEELIQERVPSGRDTSASEVVRDALRLLQDRDELRRLRMDELRAKVAAGLDALGRGEGVDGDAVIDDISPTSPVQVERGAVRPLGPGRVRPDVRSTAPSLPTIRR